MVNWNEKIRAEEIRQVEQSESQRIESERIETQKRTDEIQQEKEEQARLSVIANQGFELLASWEIEEMLKGIGRDVWGSKAKIEDVNKISKVSSRMSHDHRGYTLAVVGKKLVYEYDYPEETRESIMKRKLGHYVVHTSRHTWGSGSDSVVEGAYSKFGWHEKEVGYNIGYELHKKRTEMGVLLEGTPADDRQEDSPSSFSIRFVAYGRGAEDYLLSDVEDPRSFIETAFLNQCLLLDQLGMMPSVLDANAQRELVEIQKKMQRNPYKN